MGTLIEVQAAIQALARGLSGVRVAPNAPPDQAAAYPFVVTLPAQGTIGTVIAGCLAGSHTFQTEIHVARKNLTYDTPTLIPLLRAFYRSVLADPTLGGTVEAVGDVRYYWKAMEWGGQETRGYLIQIDVKINETV
jgi:hypothetical protein